MSETTKNTQIPHLIMQELMKYLNAEKRKLKAGFEKLWDECTVLPIHWKYNNRLQFKS